MCLFVFDLSFRHIIHSRWCDVPQAISVHLYMYMYVTYIWRSISKEIGTNYTMWQQFIYDLYVYPMLVSRQWSAINFQSFHFYSEQVCTYYYCLSRLRSPVKQKINTNGSSECTRFWCTSDERQQLQHQLVHHEIHRVDPDCQQPISNSESSNLPMFNSRALLEKSKPLLQDLVGCALRTETFFRFLS